MERPNIQALMNWLVEWLASAMEIGIEEVDRDTPFGDLGVDSARLLSLSGELERICGCRLEPTVAYEHPSVRTLSRHVRTRASQWRPEAATPIDSGSGARDGTR